MGIRLDEFWDSNYYNHPPLTDEMVSEAERQLGVRLPTEYLALLRVQNGGYTRGFGYPMTRPTIWAEDHVPLGDLFGIVIDPEHSTALNILKTEYMTREWGLPPRQALLTGDGHWWITLDYRSGDAPSVAWLAVDHGQDIQIAPSFAKFLEDCSRNPCLTTTMTTNKTLHPTAKGNSAKRQTCGSVCLIGVDHVRARRGRRGACRGDSRCRAGGRLDQRPLVRAGAARAS